MYPMYPNDLPVCKDCHHFFWQHELNDSMCCPDCGGILLDGETREPLSAQQSVQADECPSCAGSGRKEVGGMLLTCLACDGTGIRR